MRGKIIRRIANLFRWGTTWINEPNQGRGRWESWCHRNLVLTISATPTYIASAVDGVVAQLVERLNGIQEVRGSNPLGSTIQSVFECRFSSNCDWSDKNSDGAGSDCNHESYRSDNRGLSNSAKEIARG
jgi:hypothetical protein